jgi:hypothetical protein
VSGGSLRYRVMVRTFFPRQKFNASAPAAAMSAGVVTLLRRQCGYLPRVNAPSKNPRPSWS